MIMIEYKYGLCDIMKCTEYEHKSHMSSALSDSRGNLIAKSDFGASIYNGKPIHKKVPFIHVSELYRYFVYPY